MMKIRETHHEFATSTALAGRNERTWGSTAVGYVQKTTGVKVAAK